MSKKVARNTIFILIKEGKTDAWHCVNDRTMAVLGTVRWFSLSRKYMFEPMEKVAFGPLALTEIAEFLKWHNDAHKRMK